MEDLDKPAERWIVVRDGGSFILHDTENNGYLLSIVSPIKTEIARYSAIEEAAAVCEILNKRHSTNPRGSPCD